MWAEWRSSKHAADLDRVSIGGAASALVLLILYGYLVGVRTYQKVAYDPSTGGTRTFPIIGGLWLKRHARDLMRKKRVASVQDLLAGGGYDPDRLWNRPSRTLAKLAFHLSYFGMTVCLAVALEAASFRLGLVVS
jgi:hypothetical protein